MTIVIAKSFGNRIIVQSDTMITNAQATRVNAIPGRLKAISISPSASIAYAGLSDQALTAIRQCWSAMRSGEDLSFVYRILQASSEKHDIDFLILSHLPDAQLRKIRNGNLTVPLTEAAIGDVSIVRQVDDRETTIKAFFIPGFQPEELKFRQAFPELMREAGVVFNPDVGGIHTILVGSPGNHHYEPYAGVSFWGGTSGGIPETDQQIMDRKSGKTQWTYTVHTSKLRGIGVVGLRLREAGVGFVYLPLLHDEAVKVPLSGKDDVEQSENFQATLEQMAEQVGGGVLVPTKPVESISAVSTASMQKMATYAASMPNETTLRLHPEGLWLQCSTPGLSRGGLIQFKGVREDDFEDLVFHRIDEANDDISESTRARHTVHANRKP